MKTGSTWSP